MCIEETGKRKAIRRRNLFVQTKRLICREEKDQHFNIAKKTGTGKY